MKKVVIFLLPFVLLIISLGQFGDHVAVNGNFFTSLFEPDLSKAPSFPASRLYLFEGVNGYEDDAGLGSINGSIEAFGDFNSDQYTDVFVVTSDRKSLYVYLWSHSEYRFNNMTQITATSDNVPLSSTFIQVVNPIRNVVGGDFNYDGKLDILLSLQANQSSEELYFLLYFGQLDSFNEHFVNFPYDSVGQVLVMDYDADLHLDLFGTYSNSNTREFWKISDDGKSVTLVPQSQTTLSPLKLPDANAFVDINGDCLSDLFVTSTTCDNGACQDQFEIWINEKGSFKQDKVLPTVPGAGQVSFADIDADGTMDLIFPVCDPFPNCTNQNAILIIYNEQKPLCKYFWEKGGSSCRASTELCQEDPNYSLGDVSQLMNSANSVVIPRTQFGWPSTHFLSNPDFSAITLRLGDYNLDGYPDLLIPLVDQSGQTTIELWENVDCTTALCGSDANSAGRRTFSKVTDGVSALTDIQNPYAAAFFDVDENGVLDIFVLTGAGTGREIKYLFNNFFNDAFFLKTTALNGVCPSWCSSGEKFPDPKPYGVNLPGGTFKFTLNDLSGNAHVAQGVQLQQSGYLALQTPYVMFGLGRTSNYIEEIFMGVSIKNSGANYNSWICIIPNSQVIGFPYPPNSPVDWTLELFVKSSGVTLWVIVAVVSLLIINGGLIFFFRWKEKQQDRQEINERAHLFHFNAL